MAINKTEAGTFAVDFRDQFKKRIQRTFSTYKEAAAFEKEVLAQVQRRDFVRQSAETAREVAEKWHMRKVEAGTYRRSTLEAWNNHLKNYIVPAFGHLKVQQIDAETIEKAAAEWSKNLSPQTVNKMLTTLTAILAMAKRYKLVKDNAAEEAERLKVATEEEENIEVSPDEVYSKQELKKLIQATEPGTPERLLIMVPAFTGLRIGEVLAITWSAVDLKEGKLHVRLTLADSDKGQEPLFQPTKTKSSRRTIPLPQELIHELKMWKLRCPPSERNLVFVTEEGKPFHRKAVSKILDRAIIAAEVKRLTPHGLRHGFASLLLADGVPITEVSHLLGHKDSYVTLKIYAHFVRQESRSVHNLAASILAGGQA